MTRVIVDPVTRIEGHLRVEAEVTSGRITEAWSSAGLFRGMEPVLRGRQPADAFYLAQRTCGVSPVSHGHASSMATEAALQVTIPNNARLIRNIIESAQFLQSHIMWFYQLNLFDYVDAVAALDADVGATYALAQKVGTTSGDFAGVQARIRTLIAGGQLSILSGNWFGSPAYKLTPELDLIAMAHYFEAIEIQAVAGQVVALMGGKYPHFMTSLPGGTAWVPTSERLGDLTYRLKRVRAFVADTLLPDMLAIVGAYKNDMATVGVGTRNFLSWGVFEDSSRDPAKRFLPRGALVGGDLSAPVVPKPEQVIEYVDHAWYLAKDGSLSPALGLTDPAFTSYDVTRQYSWSKAPRLDGRPMETGPLARLLVAYATGDVAVKPLVDGALRQLGLSGRLDLFVSLLGRVAARVLETKLLAEHVLVYCDELVAALKAGDSALFAAGEGREGTGVGLWESPQGALGHWLDITDGEIADYQVVSPSTWNCGPRDQDGQRGPLEEALVGATVVDEKRPVEILRIVHSFDPCAGCAAH